MSDTSLMERPLDLLFTIFFAGYLVPSAFFAPQVALPPELRTSLVPEFAKKLLEQAVGFSNDPLLKIAVGAPREPWAVSIFAAESLFQAPFALYAVIALCMTIIFSTHVITTLIPIMAELAWGRKTFFEGADLHGQTEESVRMMWLSMYAPFVIVPALMLFKFAYLWNPRDFGGSKIAFVPGALGKMAKLD
ncbi:Transmembrane protein 97 [Polyrhizophydium stewartii]|uniref:Transmembrane protein 97 n=1 Tax=Polyrhizophydium stewartii TaxID=2732419 RepID=A0ABR4NBL0_9FUNG